MRTCWPSIDRFTGRAPPLWAGLVAWALGACSGWQCPHAGSLRMHPLLCCVSTTSALHQQHAGAHPYGHTRSCEVAYEEQNIVLLSRVRMSFAGICRTASKLPCTRKAVSSMPDG